MREAEAFFESLKEAFEPEREEVDEGRRLGQIYEENFKRGIWRPGDLGVEQAELSGIEFRFPEPPGQAMQQSLWKDVVKHVKPTDRVLLKKNTLVRTLNIPAADAFATSAGDEYLVVVNNAFHDIVYNFVKLAVVGSNPVPDQDAADPAWRRGPSGGRYDTAGRLLRLMLGALRWAGFYNLGIRASPPYEYLSSAATMTEFVQTSVLAHEAAHIVLGHVRTSTRRLHIGGQEIPAVEPSQQLELDADVFALDLLAKVVVDRAIMLERKLPDVLAEIMFCKFLVLDLYEDAYYVRRPESHPTPMERFANLSDRLPEWALTIDPDNFDPRHAPYVIPAIAISDLSAEAHEEGDTFPDFLKDVLATPYFTLVFEYRNPQSVAWLHSIDEAQNRLLSPMLTHLIVVAEKFFGTSPLELLPADLLAEIRKAGLDAYAEEHDEVPDLSGWIDQLVVGTLGCEVVLGDFEPFSAVREKHWDPEPGTPFHRWGEGFGTIDDYDLRMALIAISFQVVRQGADSLWVLGGDGRDALAEWLGQWAATHVPMASPTAALAPKTHDESAAAD